MTPTVAIVDGKPGVELEVDTGWMTKLEPEGGPARRFRAFIFTPNVSRYHFVYPVLRETTEAAMKPSRQAWDFYGGVFEVAVVDNTKALVTQADSLEPRLNEVFLEYAQARGSTWTPRACASRRTSPGSNEASAMSATQGADGAASARRGSGAAQAPSRGSIAKPPGYRAPHRTTATRSRR